MSLPFVIFHTYIDQKKMTMTLDAFRMDRGYERLSYCVVALPAGGSHE